MTATPHAPAVLIDLNELTRRDEILAYAQQRGIGWRQAIIELVNHALSTPAPTPQSWEDKVDAGALALMDAHPYLVDDYTASWFRKVSEVVLMSGADL